MTVRNRLSRFFWESVRFAGNFPPGRNQATSSSVTSARTRIKGRTTLEIRGEFLNAFNNVCFYSGDYGVNSTSFGRLTSTAFGPRVVQLSARFEF